MCCWPSPPPLYRPQCLRPRRRRRPGEVDVRGNNTTPTIHEAAIRGDGSQQHPRDEVVEEDSWMIPQTSEVAVVVGIKMTTMATTTITGAARRIRRWCLRTNPRRTTWRLPFWKFPRKFTRSERRPCRSSSLSRKRGYVGFFFLAPCTKRRVKTRYVSYFGLNDHTGSIFLACFEYPLPLV